MEDRYFIIEGVNGWCVHDAYTGFGSPFGTFESALYALVALSFYRADYWALVWYAENGRRVLRP